MTSEESPTSSEFVEDSDDSADDVIIVPEDLKIREWIHAGNLAECRSIIESGHREVNRADDEGCFMLQWAALSNQPEIMR